MRVPGFSAEMSLSHRGKRFHLPAECGARAEKQTVIPSGVVDACGLLSLAGCDTHCSTDYSGQTNCTCRCPWSILYSVGFVTMF
jgi:hypothetical protein